MTYYERTSQIQRAAGDAPGVISGILATDGEASDGHILNIDGMEVPERAPLLFGHDDVTGAGNLGSWTTFSKERGSKPGESRLRGSASIELGGSGAQKAWRNDVSHMIEQQHIGAFSVRWEEVGDKVKRTSLPRDHAAYVDPEKATGCSAWGYFFDRSRLLEGSVVTLGADPSALIGRMDASEGDVRSYWRRAVNHALTERVEASGLVGVQVAGGDVIYIERAAWEAMLEAANERLSIALDLHEQMNQATDRVVAEVEEVATEGERTVTRDEPEVVAEQAVRTAPLPVVSPGDVLRSLREGLVAARAAARESRTAALRRATGKAN